MSTAQDVLRQAVSELRYTESPAGSNRTKFAAEAGHVNGQPWCATYVVAMCRRAGVKLPSESAYTPTMYGAMTKVRGGLPGDIVFFDFPDSTRRIQHVGILESATSGYVVTIEGNTSPGTAGSQSNGGGVYRRTRSRSVVAGIGRPAYSIAPAPPKEIAPMFSPSLQIAAALECPTGGTWLVAPDGAIYAFGGAPYQGGANGKDYFAGRTAAKLIHAPNNTYSIVATSGEVYGPGF